MTGQPSQAVAIKSEEREITISFNDVRRYLCPDASDAEIGLFLKVCQSENLNPFRKDCYLVKYAKDQPASIIIATEVFLRSAENSPEFDGYEAGIILKPIDPKDKPEFREGSFLMDGEDDRLAGGWARVFRKDRAKPFYSAVNIKECVKYTKYGKPTRFWEEMPATMVRKVALSRALREAFTNRYSGTYTTAEIEPPPEGELPPAYQKPNGEADWKRFWARQKEKGLDKDKVHNILGISSLKEDWLGQGRTLEEAEEIINSTLQSAEEPAAATAKIKPKQAEWRAFWDRADQLGLSHKQVCEMLGVGSVADWTDRGKTLDEAIKVISEKLTGSEGGAPAIFSDFAFGEGFNISMDWLKESQKTLKWSDETLKTFLVSQYKVSPQGSLGEVISRLTWEQAEKFVKEINKRLEKQQPGLF